MPEVPRTWGGWIAGVLAAGCLPAPRPAGPAVPDPPTPAQQGAPTLAAEPIQGHERLLLRPGGGEYQRHSYRVVTGKGELFYTRFWHPSGDKECLFPSPSAACGLLSVRPRGGGGRDQIPAPRSWRLLAPGSAHAYALRIDEQRIDRIDEQGEVSLWLDDPQIRFWQAFWILELAPRPLLVSGDFQGLRAAEVQQEGTQPGRLGPAVQLPFVLAHSAQDARRARSSGSRAIHGTPLLVPRKTEGSWALVWVEAIPPPQQHPAGKPWRSGAKNGCGGMRPPSRKLGDVSVEKRVVVTRFRRLEIEGEEVGEASNELNLATQRLEVHIDGDQIKATVRPRKEGEDAPE